MVNVKEETVVRYISIFGNILHKGILVLKSVTNGYNTHTKIMRYICQYRFRIQIDAMLILIHEV